MSHFHGQFAIAVALRIIADLHFEGKDPGHAVPQCQTELDDLATASRVRALERQLGREINYTVLTRKECDSRRARKDAFLEDIWHNERFSLVGPA
jgi:hypothetical protein